MTTCKAEALEPGHFIWTPMGWAKILSKEIFLGCVDIKTGVIKYLFHPHEVVEFRKQSEGGLE